MVGIIAAKSRDLMRKLEAVSRRTIREKLLADLSLKAQIQRFRYVKILLGRVELAEYLRADRSALSREQAKMKAEGIVDFNKICFRIL